MPVVAGIDHGQDHVRGGHQVFPLLADSQVVLRGGGEPEHVDGEWYLQGMNALGQKLQVAGDALTLRLVRPARREDCPAQPLPGLVGEADVVELHFLEPESHRFRGEVSGVDPDGVVEGVHPMDSLAVGPEPAA